MAGQGRSERQGLYRHNGQTDTRYLNMTTGASGWIELGTFEFSSTGVEYVSLTRTTASSSLIYTRADAVRFERRSP
ncbi:golvesin C-terminal-like domain-containing protein [Paenibacillus hodogayensis]|uniref:golvesin C-terminal-like domain-containing protein n=1 Tax=Paenibacillus hodogayensis TaxID=279208 RepID=UPI00406BC80A